MSKERMSHVLLLIILLGTQTINAHAWEIDQTSSVTKIVDGDSFRITGDEVRLADINAPEWNQPGGTQATNALTRLISGKTVYVDTDDKSGRDQDGRLIAVVYVVHNSTHYLNVNEELLLEGTVVIDDFTNNEFNPSTWTLYVRYAPQSNSTSRVSENIVLIVSAIAVVVLTLIYLVSSRRKQAPIKKSVIVQSCARAIFKRCSRASMETLPK